LTSSAFPADPANGHRPMATRTRGRGLTRNSPCPLHPWHAIRYCKEVGGTVDGLLKKAYESRAAPEGGSGSAQNPQ